MFGWTRRGRAAFSQPPRGEPSALVALLLCFGCQEQHHVELLQVNAVTPVEAQFGDSVQVIGDGFALGNPATVTLRGQVFRAGDAPESVQLTLPARTESQRELAVVLPRAAQASICGDAERAGHATFRGDVTVAIAGRVAGTPPVTGTLRGAVLELYPALKAPAAERRSLELGSRVLSFFGLELSPAEQGGLLVVRVEPGGRAATAGILPGDRIVRAGELSVLQASDLAPAPSRHSRLLVERSGREIEIVIASDGFAAAPPRSLEWALTAVAAVSLVLLGWASPLGRVFAWALENVREYRWLVARPRVMPRRPEARRPSAPLSERLLVWLGGALGVAVWLGVGSALLAPVVRAAPLDLGLGLFALMGGSALLLGIARLFGARSANGSWSLRAGLHAVAAQLCISLPSAIALTYIALQNGFRIDDMVRSQGALPWTWNAFRDPGMAVSCVLALTGALPLAAAAAPLGSARPAALRFSDFRDSLLGWIYLCSTCALCSVAFLGGDAGRGGVRIEGWHETWFALLSFAKYTLLVLSLTGLRVVFLNLSSREWARIAARVCLPAALLAVLAAHGLAQLSARSDFARWLSAGFGAVSAAALLLSLLLGAWLAAREVESTRSGPATLSPWL